MTGSAFAWRRADNRAVRTVKRHDAGHVAGLQRPQLLATAELHDLPLPPRMIEPDCMTDLVEKRSDRWPGCSPKEPTAMRPWRAQTFFPATARSPENPLPPDAKTLCQIVCRCCRWRGTI